ncbi:hypothetical protein CROQUDRAFT_658043 [Cronartium quercuum f. sp. fusiforme G11]|uniref:Uncharacterized protein n=1 Tax=Cronartium quercuum f. sp. fusiforme G11 TaxID=708437 RepID=A0A9P6NKN8_9BASI|nr:hypothetical protein CROQUDRAFT_658043 [Cronartium quercuum f. sp. fusiforme G11]
MEVLQPRNKKAMLKVDLDQKTFDSLNVDNIDWKAITTELLLVFKNPGEAFRRVHAFQTQWNQKKLSRNWKAQQKSLPERVKELAEALQVQNEWPIFDKSNTMDWKTFCTKYDSLSPSEVAQLGALFDSRKVLNTREAMILLTSRRNPLVSKLEKDKLKEFMKQGGSVPVLTQIYDVLELDRKQVNLKKLAGQTLIDKWTQMMSSMRGQIEVPGRGAILTVDSEAWVMSYTRAYLIGTTEFEGRFKDLHTACKVRMKDRSIKAREWQESDVPVPAVPHLDNSITPAEAMATKHFGVSASVLALFSKQHLESRHPEGKRQELWLMPEGLGILSNQFEALQKYHDFLGIDLRLIQPESKVGSHAAT